VEEPSGMSEHGGGGDRVSEGNRISVGRTDSIKIKCRAAALR
jgi:hypothetical protein